jgi:Kef-type K+ transport system membrane component KefB
MLELFSEFALLLTISAVAGSLALWLRQPLLIAYIAVGVIVGPTVLGIMSAHDQIDLLAQIGVAILLFVVGLKLDLRHVKHIGPVALATGLGQLTFTVIIGFIIVLMMGKSVIEAIYIAVALTFSSTIIIVKLLSDKREIDSLHGRIAVGFLIVQDLAVVVAMMVMSALHGGNSDLISFTSSLLLKIGFVAISMYVLMKYILPKVAAIMAQSQDLLLIFAIAWGTGLAALGEWAGFSKEAGAFLAGFSLASTYYRDAINAKLTGIRDFLLLFFFIELGAKLDFSTLGNELWTSGVLSIFVLIGNPLIVLAIMGYMGYRKRTGFLAGLTVAQISEFSIIFVAMGITLGHIGQETLGLITLVGITTIAISTYMILYSHPLYERLAPLLKWAERQHPHKEQKPDELDKINPADLIILGLGRYGGSIALGLRDAGLNVIGVDFDPETVIVMKSQGLNVHFGDGMDPDFIECLPLNQVKWIISTVPDLPSTQHFLQALQDHEFNGKIILVARETIDQSIIKDHDQITVIYPLNDAILQSIHSIKEMVNSEKEIK